MLVCGGVVVGLGAGDLSLGVGNGGVFGSVVLPLCTCTDI